MDTEMTNFKNSFPANFYCIYQIEQAKLVLGVLRRCYESLAESKQMIG